MSESCQSIYFPTSITPSVRTFTTPLFHQSPLTGEGILAESNTPLVISPAACVCDAAAKSVEADKAALPSPRLERAAEAVEAPVPPLTIAKSVPDQLPLLIEVQYPALAWFPQPYAVFQFPELPPEAVTVPVVSKLVLNNALVLDQE